jgi:hypothetical protein
MPKGKKKACIKRPAARGKENECANTRDPRDDSAQECEWMNLKQKTRRWGPFMHEIILALPILLRLAMKGKRDIQDASKYWRRNQPH